MVRRSTIAARVTMTLLPVTIAIPVLLMTVALFALLVRAADPVQPPEEDPFLEAARDLYQIRGSDAANLAGTRQAQADIWRQQFPGRQCVGRRVMVVEWLSMGWHGIGSQLHVMGAVLSAAVRHNRTLVLVPGSLPQANHDDGVGRRLLKAAIKTGNADDSGTDSSTSDGADDTGDYNEETEGDVTNEDVIVAEPCDGVGCLGSDALVIFPATPGFGVDGGSNFISQLNASAADVRCLDSEALLHLPATPGFGVDGGSNFISQLNASAAELWGKAYLKSPLPNEVMGRLSKNSKFLKKAHWWRAQATRFMLRWPSAYLCHIINRERHHVYGMHVARQVVASRMDQNSMLAESWGSNKSTEDIKGFGGRGRFFEERQLLATEIGQGGTLGESWGKDKPSAFPQKTLKRFYSRSSSSRSGSGGLGDLEGERYGWDPYLANYEGVGGEPYIPRPIVSVHVRQGDKGFEMQLFSFYAVMFMANRVRRGFPNVRYAWLSTEMQSVVDQSSRFTDWTFFYSEVPRQGAGTRMSDYTEKFGLARTVGISFANLLIASECDDFVGVLASNWNRMINELKNTNGRLYSGYASLNNDEW
ncbi:unnamed protein product [Closterium sp. Yama58-4]|nr:unnamed protein product [Closterium sp. Yama58-4]